LTDVLYCVALPCVWTLCVWQAGIVPDCIYVDASHHYEDVLQDLTMCLQRFPHARICGDDWDYPPVQRAAIDAAVPTALPIHAEGGKCWAYGSFSEMQLSTARQEFYDQDVSQEALSLFRTVERYLLSQPRGGGGAGGGDDADGLFALLDQPYLDQGGQLARFVNTGFPPKGRTMLMVAAIQGRVGCAEGMLMELGADPDVATVGKRETALHLAVRDRLRLASHGQPVTHTRSVARIEAMAAALLPVRSSSIYQ
jgi:hypothetical protein